MSNYYKIAFNFGKAANWLDHKALWIAVKALCRKFDISTAECFRKYSRGKQQIGIDEKYVLKKAQDIRITWRHASPRPYEPGTGCYLDDVDWEAEVRRYERRRPGRMDLRRSCCSATAIAAVNAELASRTRPHKPIILNP